MYTGAEIMATARLSWETVRTRQGWSSTSEHGRKEHPVLYRQLCSHLRTQWGRFCWSPHSQGSSPEAMLQSLSVRNEWFQRRTCKHNSSALWSAHTAQLSNMRHNQRCLGSTQLHRFGIQT